MPPAFGDSVLLPLTSRDCAIGGVGLSVAFVLNAKPGDLDLDNLKSAVEKVVDKWRLLAGRVVFSKELNTYAVLAPIGALPEGYAPLSFAISSTPDKPSPFSDLPVLSSSSGHLIPVPTTSVYKCSSVPTSLAAYAKSEHPITAWHVAVFSDATIIGLSVPHGCFDAHGLGLVMSAVDAELHDREWVVPPLTAENQLDKRLDEVKKMEFSEDEKNATPPPMIGWTGAWPPSNVVKLLSNGLFESKWHQAEDGCVFVGRELLDDVVKEVKTKVQLETAGQEFVSEGDILVAWFYKAIYQYDPNPPTSFFASCAVSLRSLVSTPETQLDLYPHNAVSGYSLISSSPLETSTFLSTPPWELALGHRRMLNASRTLPAAQALLEWIDTNTSPTYPALPMADCSWATPWGKKESTGYWIYSNQIASDMTTVSFPHAKTGERLPLKAFLELGTSLDQFVMCNQLNGDDGKPLGWIFGATMRRARWESVRRTVEEAKERVKESK
ncbi:hypothetical protein JCM8547_007212 [Rhodosporidiobolus lusitaniae]